MARDEQQRREMGARIKELRAERGLKQQFIADRCGVTLRTFQMWQAGDTEPRQEQLEKLAELLEVTPRYILRGQTPEPFQAADTTLVGRLEDQLAAVTQTLALLRAENETRHAELIAHIDERTQPIQADPRRRRRA